MRVSFSTGTFYHRSLRYSLELAREAGYDGVEAVLGPGYLLRDIGPWQRALETVGVPILSVHPPFYPFPGWPRVATSAIPRVTTAVRLLGAQLGVVHTPFVMHEHAPRAERYTEGLRLGREAGGPRIEIGLESSQYNKRARRYYLDDLDNLTRFAADRGVSITFDTCHAGANGQDLLASYEIIKPVLRNVHLSDVVWRDGKPKTHRLPGEGALPLAAFLARLASDGYDGLITLEIHPAEVGLMSRSRQLARLRQAHDFVRAAIGQTPARREATAGS